MSSRWLAIVLLLACGKSAPDRDDKSVVMPAPSPSPAPSPTPRTVEVPEPAIALPRELAFELLELGSGKRAPLRYALATGTRNLVARTQLTSRELVDGTWRDAPKAPATTSELAVSLDSGGRATLAASGATITVAIDSRGRMSGLADQASSAEDIVQRVLATAVPLPEEPVGDGARWRVVTAFRQQGAVLKQTATYTLVSRGARWKIGVDVQRLAEAQRVGGVELVAIVRRLQGTFEVDPAAPFPRAGTLAVQSSVHARSGGRGAAGGAGAADGETIAEDTGTIELHSGDGR